MFSGSEKQEDATTGVNCERGLIIEEDSEESSSSSSSPSSSGEIGDGAVGTGGKTEDDPINAIAIWTEDIILDPGTIRYPIRVVVVDNHFQTRMDRLVKLPEGSTTYIYRVLDHGIPWQHLEAGLTLEEARKEVVALAKGKRLVVYDAWKTIGLFEYSEQQISRLKICDLRASNESLGADGEPLPFWDLVHAKLGHRYTGKPGNYDTLELTDFVMSIYHKYMEKEGAPEAGSSIVDQLQLPLQSST